ncbi:hypothetical protein LXL04_032795 [Taraxacum kok-saghyz]
MVEGVDDGAGMPAKETALLQEVPEISDVEECPIAGAAARRRRWSSRRTTTQEADAGAGAADGRDEIDGTALPVKLSAMKQTGEMKLPLKLPTGEMKLTQAVRRKRRLDSMSSQGADEFWAEVKMLSKLRHCHLVSLLGYCDDGKEMILVYEYMPHGSLEDHLHKLYTRLSWLQRLKLCIGAARGLDYLHTGTCIEFGVIHRDVKTANILLDESWASKIADLGLSRKGPNTGHVSTLVKGTFGYLDPDYYSTGKLTMKSDVYAFGVVLFEVLCRKRASDGFAHTAKRCLQNHPKRRPTMAEVVFSLESVLHLQEDKNNSLQPWSKPILGWMVDMLKAKNGKNSDGDDIVVAVETPIEEIASGPSSPSVEIVVADKKLIEESFKGHAEWMKLHQNLVPSFLEHVENRQIVDFRSLDRPKENDFYLELSKLHTYDDVVERVAQKLGLDDPSKIRLTPHNCYSQQPKPKPIKYRVADHLVDMLVHYKQISDILYYEVWDIPLPELQCLKTLKVVFHPAKKEEDPNQFRAILA